ncbi:MULTISPECIES: hypothetical protein [Rhodonellum]|uniref:hypothetical protein n=1 Tax=Rhodonellum TaxID=336827 RepID=UPI0003667A79|nr:MULTISPECIES: hypothetical protein [Rhodonellum]
MKVNYCIGTIPSQFGEEISALIFWLLFDQAKSDKEKNNHGSSPQALAINLLNSTLKTKSTHHAIFWLEVE